MRSIITLCLFALLSPLATADDGVDVYLSGGLATGELKIDNGPTPDTDGVFANIMATWGEGGGVRFGWTGQDTDGTAELERFDVGVGWTFRRDTSFRPFIFGGFAVTTVEDSSIGLDDRSQGATATVGFTAGGERHGFYFDASYDFSMDIEGVEYDAIGLRSGYALRF